MNNFEKIKNMSIEDFINAIDTGIFKEWNKNTITNWLKQEEIDWTKIPKDTKVLVRNKERTNWIPRYFCRYEYNMKSPYLVFKNGATSWTNEGKPLATYEYCKLADEELTPETLTKEHNHFCDSKYFVGGCENCECGTKDEVNCQYKWL